MNRKLKPPKWADKLLGWYCSERFLEEVQGDLHEWFCKRVERQGIIKAKLLYFLDVIRFFRTFRLKSLNELNSKSTELMLVSHYVKIAFRNFRKFKLYYLINVGGLSLGIASCMLVVLLLQSELGFDQFHSQVDKLYRLNKYVTSPEGEVHKNAESSGMMGPTIADQFPEVEDFVRFTWFSGIVFSYQDRNFSVDKVAFADQSFFTMFDFKLQRGDRSTVLKDPLSVVLTEDMAKKLFKDEDPIGKQIVGLRDLDYTVTGISENAPYNSHIKYDLIISWASTISTNGALPYDWMNNWNTQTMATYLKIRNGANLKGLENNFIKMIDTHLPEKVNTYKLYLQPFSDIYLGSGDIVFQDMMGSRKYNQIVSLIAAFILLIACINYINIYTSKSVKRTKEVGVRKVLGASKIQLVNQYLGEAFLVTIVSAVTALILAYFFLPYFNQLADKELNFYALFDPVIMVYFGALIIFIAVISGLYPAFVLSSLAPTDILNSQKSQGNIRSLPRQILITVQYAISIALIIGTIFIYKQTNYMLTRDIGFSKDHIITMESLPKNIRQRGEAFKQEILSHSMIKSATMCNSLAYGGYFTEGFYIDGMEENEVEARGFPVDADFITTMDMEIVMGRDYNKDLGSDSASVIVNQTFAKKLGDNVLGRVIRIDDPNGKDFRVIGVVGDFNYNSLHHKVEPLVMYPDNSYWNLSVKVDANNISGAISFLKQKWEETESRVPFDYKFVDQEIASLYAKESKLTRFIFIFSFISIFITCLGLYGLTSFIIEQKTKEFGIRKVLGATGSQLAFLVNRKFTLLSIIGLLLATPVVYYFIRAWLENFAYQISVTWVPFLLAWVMLIMISFIAVGYHSIKVARLNPVNSIKEE